MIVLIDSREQDKLEFKVAGNVSKVETLGLAYGDYACMYENGKMMKILFERKSIPDLYATLSNEVNIERHKKKMIKAKEQGMTLLLAIEGTLTEVSQGAGYSKVEPDPLIKRIFTFMVKYDFYPVFCKDRKEMVRFMLETWEAFGRNFKPEGQLEATR